MVDSRDPRWQQGYNDGIEDDAPAMTEDRVYRDGWLTGYTGQQTTRAEAQASWDAHIVTGSDAYGLGLTIRDPGEDVDVEPCVDCGRTYTKGEQVLVTVARRSEPVWVGCIDCWVRRTSPAVCETFASAPDRPCMRVEQGVVHDEHTYRLNGVGGYCCPGLSTGEADS